MVGMGFHGVGVSQAQGGQRFASRGSISEAKARQSTKIKELGAALAAAGLVGLDEQARALGLSRSTAWTILKANHKASGLSAATINRMLLSTKLPQHVRATLLTYVEEKVAGLYGHNKIQLRRFAQCFYPSNYHWPERSADENPSRPMDAKRPGACD